jgi:methionyl-tRNA synthetase
VGVDALRYFLLREIPFGSDGSFSFDALVARYNSDLANGLGNLVSRTLSMIHQYRKGLVPACPSGGDNGIGEKTNETIKNALEAYGNFEFAKALELIWSLVSVADKFIVTQAPWTLVKKQDEASQAALDATLYTALEVVRVVTALVAPVIPDSAARIWAQLALTEPVTSVRLDQLAWGQLAAGHKVGEPSPVFPRIDAKIAVPKMQELEVAESARQAKLVGKKAEEPAAAAPPVAALAPEIAIDDFMKVDLRVGLVKTAEVVKGADKLLHLSVDIGEPEPRSIVAGIAKAYTPEQMVGRKVMIVANLQPRKLRGIPSQGMIVAASLEGETPVLAAFLEDVPIGARLK